MHWKLSNHSIQDLSVGLYNNLKIMNYSLQHPCIVTKSKATIRKEKNIKIYHVNPHVVQDASAWLQYAPSISLRLRPLWIDVKIEVCQVQVQAHLMNKVCAYVEWVDSISSDCLRSRVFFGAEPILYTSNYMIGGRMM